MTFGRRQPGYRPAKPSVARPEVSPNAVRLLNWPKILRPLTGPRSDRLQPEERVPIVNYSRTGARLYS
jgi:hypothetical protein